MEVRRRSGAIAGLAALVLVLVLCILASAAGAGPWERRVETGEQTPEPPPTEYIPPEAAEPPAGGERPTVLDIDPVVLRTVLIILAILAIAGLVVLAVRFARSVRWGTRTSAPTRAGAGAGTEVEEVVDAVALVSGIEEAQAALSADVRTADAIIAAWLALERAADASGAPRRPSQTPTEFTAVVLQRVPADESAVRELLELYSHARFSTVPLPPESADAARAALRRISASWSAIEALS